MCLMYLVTTKENARNVVLYCLFDYISNNALESSLIQLAPDQFTAYSSYIT